MKRRDLLVSLGVATAGAAASIPLSPNASAQGAENFEVIVPDALRPFYESLHFAPAVKEGGRLYCSGMLGLGPDGNPIADPAAQFDQVFATIKELLRLGGATFADILEVTSYHVQFEQHLGVLFIHLRTMKGMMDIRLA